MKERPILFSAPMVRAILEGRKTQTRRLLKAKDIPQPMETAKDFTGVPLGMATNFNGKPVWSYGAPWGSTFGPPLPACPYGQPGDRLWARENFFVFQDSWDRDRGPQPIQYMADDGNDAPQHGGVGKPSIHMPRWASRILLEVAEVRVRRLQEISEEDAEAEGVNYVDGMLVEIIPASEGMPSRVDARFPCHSHRKAFERLWDSINSKRGHGWEKNEWVWAITFRRLKP